MKYTIYKLSFYTGIHIGEGRLSKSGYVFCADIFFSALCQEALKLYGESGIVKLLNWTRKEKLLLSDGMPYIGNTFYLPKPMVRIEKENQDASVRKQAKKLSFVSLQHYDEFLQGNLDFEVELKEFSRLGKLEVRTRLNKRDDTGPYQVGVFHYGRNAGIYVIIAYEEEEVLDYIEDLLYSLGCAGIGGKISSGLGKFEPMFEEMPESLEQRLSDYQAYPNKITLSVSLPKENELEESLHQANYGIVLRSGFIASSTYAENFQKKKDLYCIKAGSLFFNTYKGDVYDVSAGGTHPVYRYAKPMFMGVGK